MAKKRNRSGNVIKKPSYISLDEIAENEGRIDAE